MVGKLDPLHIVLELGALHDLVNGMFLIHDCQESDHPYLLKEPLLLQQVLVVIAVVGWDWAIEISGYPGMVQCCASLVPCAHRRATQPLDQVYGKSGEEGRILPALGPYIGNFLVELFCAIRESIQWMMPCQEVKHGYSCGVDIYFLAVGPRRDLLWRHE